MKRFNILLASILIGTWAHLAGAVDYGTQQLEIGTEGNKDTLTIFFGARADNSRPFFLVYSNRYKSVEAQEVGAYAVASTFKESTYGDLCGLKRTKAKLPVLAFEECPPSSYDQNLAVDLYDPFTGSGFTIVEPSQAHLNYLEVFKAALKKNSLVTK